MNQATPYRTVGVTLAGLGYLLLLALIGGKLALPTELIDNLAYAGAAMVLGHAAKTSVERVAQTKQPRNKE